MHGPIYSGTASASNWRLTDAHGLTGAGARVPIGADAS
jgi:hypothetical protein